MPERRRLPHATPSWMDITSEVWFVTICCRDRDGDTLTNPATAGRLIDSAVHLHERGDWHVHLLLLMPDHCHAILSTPGDRAIIKTIRDWKRWTARELQIKWQTDFFEHRIRNKESRSQKWDYIRENPVRAGLVERAEQWPYTWRAA